MKATGIVRRIDDLGRVVIPKEIRRTMRIREGDPLEIFTDRDGEVIFKKYSPLGELSEFAGRICESLARTAECTAAVTDRDAIIAVSGALRKELLDKPISPELEEIMAGRSIYRAEGTCTLPVIRDQAQHCLSIAAPILSEGDVMGCILFSVPRGEPTRGELEYKLAQTVAAFLGKQMEI